MPLPKPETSWPPVRLATVLPRMNEWSAWLSGEPERLAGVYGGDSATLRELRPERRSVVGRLRARMFWSGRQTDVSQPAAHRLHIPIAADLAVASSALMFGTPPAITTKDKNATAQMTRLIEERYLWENYGSAFTVAGGMGGTYLRATWDPTVEGGAFNSWVDADKASPVWSPYGDLMEVTFWRTLDALTAGSVTVWRHLERHYLADGSETIGGRKAIVGTGLVEHTLWAGTDTNIGNQQRFSAHYAMRPFEITPGADPALLTITSGSLGLCVEYVKNKPEQLAWRDDPVGAFMGRSDFDQLEGEFDALDRVWSSLIREIDLAKARVFVPASLVRSLGAGAGGALDADRELFVTLDIPTQLTDSLDTSMKMSDFPIRVDEHIKAANEIQQGIIRDAGYSARTFGEDENGQAMTATEVVDRNSRSGVTRQSKINLAGPAIRRNLMKILNINASLPGVASTPAPADLTLVWPTSDNETPQSRAQSIQQLDAAGAISTWMKVVTANPTFDKDDLLTEYRRIRSEGVADPALIGSSSAPADDPFTPDQTIPDPTTSANAG